MEQIEHLCKNHREPVLNLGMSGIESSRFPGFFQKSVESSSNNFISGIKKFKIISKRSKI